MTMIVVPDAVHVFYPTLRGYLDGPHTYIMPAPGGSALEGKETTQDDVDAYLAAVAALIKEKGFDAEQIVTVLLRKIGQIQHQEHFGLVQDTAAIARMRNWIREVAQ